MVKIFVFEIQTLHCLLALATYVTRPTTISIFVPRLYPGAPLGGVPPLGLGLPGPSAHLGSLGAPALGALGYYAHARRTPSPDLDPGSPAPPHRSPPDTPADRRSDDEDDDEPIHV